MRSPVFRSLLLVCSALLAALASPIVAQEQKADSNKHRAGINLNGVSDWSTELPFVDIFRSARAWQLVDGGGQPQLTPDGFPLLQEGQEAWTLLVREIKAHYPAGVYTLEYQGTGEVRADFDAKEVLEERPGFKKIRVVPGNEGIRVTVLRTDPADPVRNIRVWMPGFGPGEPDEGTVFNPLFIERLAPFSVLRFMDWGSTNNSKIATWDDRPEPDYASFSMAGGVPLEVMVDLANATGKDPWICIPHLADDDYVRRMAALINTRLEPGLTPYIELSNEVWNWQFEQARHAQREAERQNLGDPQWLRAYAKRSAEVLDICRGVFGSRPMVGVISAQAGNPWTSEQVLSFGDAYKSADVLAIAPYFNISSGNDADGKANVAKLTAPVVEDFLASSGIAWTDASRELLRQGKVSEALKAHGYQWGSAEPYWEKLREAARAHVQPVFDQARASIAGNVTKWIRENKAIAQRYDLPLVAYEGGQHLVGVHEHVNNEVLTTLLVEVNRQPEMYDLYREYLRVWDKNGGGLFCAFSYVGAPGKWGSWGALEWLDQPIESAPKFRALVDWATGSHQ